MKEKRNKVVNGFLKECDVAEKESTKKTINKQKKKQLFNEKRKGYPKKETTKAKTIVIVIKEKDDIL